MLSKSLTAKALLGIVAAAAVTWLAVAALNRGAADSAGRPQADQIPAVVAQIAREVDFPYELEALGTARANESIDVTSKVSEVITAIHFAEGQQVAAGDVLVEVQNTEALAELAEARAALVESRSQFDRSKELFNTRAVSESELERLAAQLDADNARVQAAEARLADTVIRAPFAGRVGLRRVSPGSLVSSDTIVTTLDDTSAIKLDFSVPERFLAPLQVGLDITADSIAYPGKTFTGEVISIDTRIDPVTRSVRVRALIPNNEDLLKPGMFLNVQVIRSRDTALVVPEQCLVPEQDHKFVFVITDNIVHKRVVTTGRRRLGEVEILSGLEAGDLVVVEGTQKVTDGKRVAVRTAESGERVKP